MKTIGLLGGMSWESTLHYYQIINEGIHDRLGGLHSAKLILYSVEFAELEKLQPSGRWEECGELLGKAARQLEAAGADFILICSNTIHKVIPQIASAIRIPVLHIADAVADALVENHIQRVGLLGTRYTMTQDFYKTRLSGRGVDVLVPDDIDQESINTVIFEELCVGKITVKSKKSVQRMIETLKARGAEGVILGCTELGLLIHPADVSIPIFDTTVLHAKRAVEAALVD